MTLAKGIEQLFGNLRNTIASATVMKGDAGRARNAQQSRAMAAFASLGMDHPIVEQPQICSCSSQALQVPCFPGFASVAASAAREPRPH